MNKLEKIFDKLLNVSPRKIIDKIEQILSNTLFNSYTRKVTCKIYNGSNEFEMKMPLIIPDNYKEMIDGTYEDILIKQINKDPKKDNLTLWDIGSHIGYQSFVFASNTKPKIKVLSFEPNPKNVEWFKEYLRLNKSLISSIQIFDKAVSDKVEKISFNISNKNDSSSSGGFIDNVEPPLSRNVYKNFKKISIQTTTIDTLISEGLDVPDIIKIDTEGAELKVLQGGIETLKKYSPELLIEIHNIPMMFYTTKLLTDLNYSIEILDEENSIYTKIIYARKK